MTSTLFAELSADPLGRGYAQMSDAQVAESLNAADIPEVGFIDPVLLRQRLVMMACESDPTHALALTHWRALAASQPAPEDEAATARWRIASMLVAAYDARVAVKLGAPEIAAIAGQAVILGLLSAEQLVILNADATRLISRAAELGLGPISHETIAEARRG